MMVGALAQRIFGKHQIVGGIDQGNMRERLRKVADETLGARIVLLRQQPDVVARPAQALEQLLRLGAAAELRPCQSCMLPQLRMLALQELAQAPAVAS